MSEFDLPYVKPERDRKGRLRYWYFRRNGRRWRLPSQPLSEAFMVEYRRLVAATEPPNPSTGQPALLPGSFGALVRDYLNSKVEFGEKKPGTQRVYRAVLEPLAEAHGDKPVALLERRHITQW